MDDSIFAKIVRRELPAEIVYEDADTLAFLDVAPRNAGHTLVIPKEPARNIFDIEESSLDKVMKTVKKVARAVQEATKADGINISINNEEAAGQIVFYFHCHVIPRFRGDHAFPPHHAYKDGEMTEVASAIREALKNTES